MPDNLPTFGAVFDAAVVDGDLSALLQLRRHLDALDARVQMTQAVLDAKGVADSHPLLAEHEALCSAVAAFGNRGAAVPVWHRLVRWLAVAEQGADQGTRRAHSALADLAVQRRAKSIKKFRQWLASPVARTGRNQVVRALSQAPLNQTALSGIETLWAQQRTELCTGGLTSVAELARAWHIVLGWQALWRAADLNEPLAAASLRRQLAKAVLAHELDERLARTLKYTDDLALWHCAGGIQGGLQDRAREHRLAVRNAAMSLRVPLHPRFARSAAG